MNKKLIDLDVFSKFVKDLIFKLNGKAPTNHSHQYAGSSEIGGSANSAVKLDVSAGAENQPVYFKDGKPVKTKYELNATVPANAKFTEYTSKPAVSDGTDVSLVTTGEKAIWNAKTSNAGTITGIKMNGTSKGSTGVVDLGTVLTSGSQTTTSDTDGGSNVYTFSDGSTITVKNGSKGSTGANGTTPTIKVAAGSNIDTVGTPSVTATTSGTTTTFTFNNLKGAKGDPGVNATTTAPFTGATTSAAGKTGLVPAPSTGAANRYLRSDGTWVVPPDTNTVTTATTSGNGNAITSVSASNGALTFTKGSTFLTSHQNLDDRSKIYAETSMTGLGFTAKSTITPYQFLSKLYDKGYIASSIVPFKWADANAAIVSYGSNSVNINGGTLYVGKMENLSSTWKEATVFFVSNASTGSKITVITATTNENTGTSSIQSVTNLTKNTNTTYTAGTGISLSGTTFSLATASSTLGGVKTTSTVTSTSGLTACPIISGVPYYKDTNTVYTHPTTSGNNHIPSGGSSGQILRWSADGTAVWGADNNTTYSDFVKSGSTAAHGLVPKPPTTAGTTKYLREDGTWVVPPNNTYSSLKNPYAITIQGNGTTLTNGTYDGSVAKTVNITPANIGACKATDGIVNNSFKVTKSSGATLTTTAAADKITMSTDKKLFIGDDSGFASSTKIYGTFDHAQTVLYSSTSSSTLTSVSIANLFTEYSLIWINIQGSKTSHSHVVPLKYLKSKGSIIFKDAGSSAIVPLNLLYVSDTEMRWFEYQAQGAETYTSVQIVKIY